MLGDGREVGGGIRRQQRNLIFLAEQEERVVLDHEEPFDLGLAGAPEHTGHGKARQKRDQTVGNALGERPATFQQIDEPHWSSP